MNSLQPPLPTPIALAALTAGRVEVRGQFVYGSNATLFVDVFHNELTTAAVYKPEAGGTPLWDFDARSLCRREAAAYLVSSALGWDFVPPTVLRADLPYGFGSLQAFIPHDPQQHYFSFTPALRATLKPVVVFDLLLNNADRKGGHLLLDAAGKVWLIDHGLCFHTEKKLRSVIWDFGGLRVPRALLEDVRRLLQALQPDAELGKTLTALLSVDEVQALRSRAERLLTRPIFPRPSRRVRQFPWPLV